MATVRDFRFLGFGETTGQWTATLRTMSREGLAGPKSRVDHVTGDTVMLDGRVPQPQPLGLAARVNVLADKGANDEQL